MPALPRAWSDPFLEQAREDLKAAWAVPPGTSPSTLCMLIQMVFEKLAKAAYARQGQFVKPKHEAVTHLFYVLLRHPDPAVQALLQASSNARQFVAELEAAHPAVVADHAKQARKAGLQVQVWPQLEYPWEDPVHNTVHYPARDLSLARRVKDPQDRIAVDSLRFASALEKQFTTIFP